MSDKSPTNGTPLDETQFIFKEGRNADKSEDHGRIPKLELNGFLSLSFLDSYINFGDGRDGDATITTPTTITRDMFYENLTLNSVMTTNGYRVFVKNTLNGTGTFRYNGEDGGDGQNGDFVTGGVRGLSASIVAAGPLKNGRGADGGVGASTSNNQGGVGSVSDTSNFGNDYTGGVGGQGKGGNTGGSSGALGGISVPNAIFLIASGLFSYFLTGLGFSNIDGAVTPVVAGGGSGGGGGRTGERAAGGGGAGANSGGTLIVFAKIIAGTFNLEAIGGIGGKGGNGVFATTRWGGGGGGGGGGCGGFAVLVSSISTWTGLFDVSGGIGGLGGDRGNGADVAESGATGNEGVAVNISV